MKFRPWIKVILVGASILTLAACSTGRKHNTQDTVNNENMADNEAMSSGIGDETRFGDQAAGAKRVAANGRDRKSVV